jgi:hypothetical protein
MYHIAQTYSILKRTNSLEELREIFLNHSDAHNECYPLYTDGSKSDDGTGYAFVGDYILYSRRIQDEASIYSAELLAIYDAIAHADTLVDHDDIVIYGLAECYTGNK